MSTNLRPIQFRENPLDASLKAMLQFPPTTPPKIMLSTHEFHRLLYSRGFKGYGDIRLRRGRESRGRIRMI